MNARKREYQPPGELLAERVDAVMREQLAADEARYGRFEQQADGSYCRVKRATGGS